MRILVAGIGNIFHGDDAFGVEVAARLSSRPLPPEVRVVDFGIRAFDLACALLDSYDVTVLVDAAAVGGPPGTLCTMELDPNSPATDDASPLQSGMHGLTPTGVLRMAAHLGGPVGRVMLVGCQPETFGPEDEGQMGLSDAVAASVETAAGVVEALVKKLLEENRPAESSGAAA